MILRNFKSYWERNLKELNACWILRDFEEFKEISRDLMGLKGFWGNFEGSKGNWRDSKGFWGFKGILMNVKGFKGFQIILRCSERFWGIVRDFWGFNGILRTEGILRFFKGILILRSYAQILCLFIYKTELQPFLYIMINLQ